jgi:hypothetical protein
MPVLQRGNRIFFIVASGRLDCRTGPAVGELLCEMAPCSPLYSRKPTPRPQAPCHVGRGVNRASGGAPTGLPANL